MGRRAVTLGALLLAFVLLYVGVFTLLYRVPPHTEQIFAETGSASPLNIYITMVYMDPVREELTVHFDFATIVGPHGGHYPGVPQRNMVVHVGDGNSVQDINLQAQTSAAPITLRVWLRGSVGDYPFDRYHGHISVSATPTVEGAPQPVRLIVWPVMSNWTIAAEQANPPPSSGVALDINVTRPAPFISGMPVIGPERRSCCCVMPRMDPADLRWMRRRDASWFVCNLAHRWLTTTPMI